ncbi:UDP-N-acetylenolpyruvoylglucosamine reductase [Luteitalea sp. TBR-22]|uniref:UDP-N-acetylmuramate dehydrogenase n=1 Tax=Luteitalea sp. TBR-22 TaxID=2802971 RepID=UPI001AF4E8A3|nr:UDP-N-acetylmuramate dehydrogenase [Luteitalea sp. TBR-22]BCS33876.1 UDP-N-acetylenolpyruvoylglucosamine reductase [Luteitalea sp. TBR-22]
MEVDVTREQRAAVVAALRKSLTAGQVEVDVPLARLTTMRVGGPAEVLVTVATAADAVATAAIARAHDLPITVLGGGSNVLVADRGARGIVLRMHGGEVRAEGDDGVRADAGVTINGLVRWMVGRGLAGLESWAGTPGTVGGAICGNAHFQGRLISEHVREVRLLQPSGAVVDVPAADMAFGYDRSRLQHSGEVALSVVFDVAPGAAPEQLRLVARESLAFRKRTQPLHQASAGCIFQNPGPEAPVPDGVPRSAGALIDKAGLKGEQAGGAQVSPLHANFIVARPGATAADIRGLVERCRDAVHAGTGVRLEEEIVYLGDWADSSERHR